MPANANTIRDQRLIDYFNKIEAKINELIAEGEIAVDPLDLSDEEE